MRGNDKLGEALDAVERENCFDELYRYIDMSNEQICLRMSERVGADVWENWQSGIKANLALPAFAYVWEEIKGRSENVRELRQLEEVGFVGGPRE